MIVTPEKVAKEKITKWVKIESIKKDVKQKQIAEVLHMTQENVSHKVKNGSFKAYEIVLLYQKLGFDIASLED